jgi:hypothetical protein
MPETFDTENLSERLARLGAFADVFAADGFRFAEMRGGNETEPGVFQMPWSELGEQAMAFHQLCYDDGWVVPFDWGSWKDTPEAIGLRDEPDTLSKATPEQLSKLLTTLVRQERFCEGSLQDAFETGLLTGIVKRAKALSEETGNA